MKSKRERGSLFGLLARHYILFTLTLLLLTAGIYALWNASLNWLYDSADWEALLADGALYRGDYAHLERHLAGGSAFAVLDGEGKLLYACRDYAPALAAGELACVPAYGAQTITEAIDYTDEAGQIRHILKRSDYDGGTEAAMVLDGDYRVLSGGFGDGRSAYTPEEYARLAGYEPEDGTLTRFDFSSNDGGARILLMKDVWPQADDYLRAYQSSWQVWLLFFPLYGVTAGVFIAWLGRKIRRPLARLNEAVTAQAAGRPLPVGDCGGTREIRRIGESFDALCAQLAESETQRQKLDEGRQKLIADISHDLKTPVTVIAGYANAICDGKVPPEETRRYLTVIQSKAAALTELIDAFHEYSKVEHPDFVLHPARVDLCEFCREYLAKRYDEIDLAGFTLEIAIPDAPFFCLLDELQFRRVLDNLLSNSLRHNRLGTLLFFELRAVGGYAELRVGDNGAGIPPERAAAIFEPFVTGSDARSGGGSGLGLAITARIMALHGGAIALASPPTRGRSTEFVLRLPRDTDGACRPE